MNNLRPERGAPAASYQTIPDNITAADLMPINSLMNGVHRTMDFMSSSISKDTRNRAGVVAILTTAGMAVIGIALLEHLNQVDPNKVTVEKTLQGLVNMPIITGLVAGGATAILGSIGDITRAAGAVAGRSIYDNLAAYVTEAFTIKDHTQLTEKEFKEAMETGICPEKFIDTITASRMKDPVTFPADPNRTAFDRSTIKKMEETGQILHPTLRKPLSQLAMAEMRELKGQIAKFTEKWGDEDALPY
jgi:U-box domain